MTDGLAGVSQGLFSRSQEVSGRFSGGWDDGGDRVHGVGDILADDLGDLIQGRIGLADGLAGISQGLFGRAQQVPGGFGGRGDNGRDRVDGVGHILAGQSQGLLHQGIGLTDGLAGVS